MPGELVIVNVTAYDTGARSSVTVRVAVDVVLRRNSGTLRTVTLICGSTGEINTASVDKKKPLKSAPPMTRGSVTSWVLGAHASINCKYCVRALEVLKTAGEVVTPEVPLPN